MSGCFWPEDEPRIHAKLIGTIEPSRGEGVLELRLILNNRAEIHGEVSLLVPWSPDHGYQVGAIYAAYFKKTPFDGRYDGCFWPENEPRIHAIITSVSPPFDCGKTVEVRLKVYNRPEVSGEVTLRVPAKDGRLYAVGAEYSAHFKLVSKSTWY